jgi:hypothetical protein
MFLSCSDSTLYSGYVYDENQQALSEVKVQIVGSDIVTYTDENGFFSLDHKELGFEILIIKPDYKMKFYTPESSSEEIKLILKQVKDN